MNRPFTSQVSAGERYTRTARLLHWFMLLALACMLVLGFYVHGLKFSPTRIRLVNYHKWAGITLLVLVVLRLIWRVLHHPPALPASLSRLAAVSANAMHYALYALMFAIPVSGWLMSSAKGYQTVWFGILPLPNLVQRNAQLGTVLLNVHAALNLTLIALVVGHAAAALKHHWFDHDGILRRMLP